MQDLVDFKNPSGYWTHMGDTIVQLMPDARRWDIPGIRYSGNRAFFHGVVGQSMGGIQMRVDQRDFGWSYKHIICIRRGDASLVWVNRDFKSML